MGQQKEGLYGWANSQWQASQNFDCSQTRIKDGIYSLVTAKGKGFMQDKSACRIQISKTSSLSPVQKGLLLIVQLRKKLSSDLVSQSDGIRNIIESLGLTSRCSLPMSKQQCVKL